MEQLSDHEKALLESVIAAGRALSADLKATGNAAAGRLAELIDKNIEDLHAAVREGSRVDVLFELILPSLDARAIDSTGDYPVASSEQTRDSHARLRSAQKEAFEAIDR